MKQLFFCIVWLSYIFLSDAVGQQTQKFTNPLLPAGADPWCIYKNGFYYYTHTLDQAPKTKLGW